MIQGVRKVSACNRFWSYQATCTSDTKYIVIAVRARKFADLFEVAKEILQ